jgi:hypothetical protein
VSRSPLASSGSRFFSRVATSPAGSEASTR